MDSTIPPANTHTAQSLNSDSSRGNSYGTMFYNHTSDSGVEGKENRFSNTVAVEWHHTDEAQNSIFKGYLNDLPMNTRRMSPVIASQTHQSYAQHTAETLSRAEVEPTTFRNLTYSTAKATSLEANGTVNVNPATVERWERSQKNLYQHPIIASRASMQLAQSNMK